jgi:hypothetical protein
MKLIRAMALRPGTSASTAMIYRHHFHPRENEMTLALEKMSRLAALPDPVRSANQHSQIEQLILLTTLTP